MNTLFQRHSMYLANAPMAHVRSIMEKIRA